MWPFLRLQITLRGEKAAPAGRGQGGRRGLAELHAQGWHRQRGPAATGQMRNQVGRNDPTYDPSESPFDQAVELVAVSRLESNPESIGIYYRADAQVRPYCSGSIETSGPLEDVVGRPEWP